MFWWKTSVSYLFPYKINIDFLQVTWKVTSHLSDNLSREGNCRGNDGESVSWLTRYGYLTDSGDSIGKSRMEMIIMDFGLHSSARVIWKSNGHYWWFGRWHEKNNSVIVTDNLENCRLEMVTTGDLEDSMRKQKINHNRWFGKVWARKGRLFSLGRCYFPI